LYSVFIMSESLEALRQLSPVIVLTGHIATRGAELEQLSTLFIPAMEIVSDMQRVNEVLETSERPELVMTRQVPQVYGDSPDNLGRINNFIPDMRSFGIRQYEKDTSAFAKKGAEIMVGRRPFDEDEKAVIQLLSGREGSHEFQAFAAEQGIDKDFAHEVLMMSHTDKKAFARMLIICSELTWHLIDKCLDKVGDTRTKQVSEELYVAYALMSRLVDENDQDARRNGEDNDWALCH
jgi:hypothetical protein